MSESLHFSVIIPTRNRDRQLRACLESIAALDYPNHRFEVVVVNDGGKVPVDDITAPYQDRLNLVLLNQAGAGPAAARNAGAKKAGGHYLAFTDDDCTVAPDWLEKLEKRFRENPRSAYGGQTINALAKNAYSAASQLLVTYLYRYYNTDHNSARFLTTNNIAFPATLFRAIGGFDPNFKRAAAEDRDFCDRWRLAGYRMTYAPEIEVYHSHPLDLPKYWRQHFHYGRGAFGFQRARAKRAATALRLEPLQFYTELLLYPFRSDQTLSPFFLSWLLMVSQIGNAAGFFWEWGSRLRKRNA